MGYTRSSRKSAYVVTAAVAALTAFGNSSVSNRGDQKTPGPIYGQKERSRLYAIETDLEKATADYLLEQRSIFNEMDNTKLKQKGPLTKEQDTRYRHKLDETNKKYATRHRDLIKEQKKLTETRDAYQKNLIENFEHKAQKFQKNTRIILEFTGELSKALAEEGKLLRKELEQPDRSYRAVSPEPGRRVKTGQ